MPALATTPQPPTGTVRVNLPPLRARRRAVKTAPAAPLPIPAPPLTPLQRLQQDAENLSQSRASAADLEGHLYEVRAYDPDRDIVYLQRNDIAANAVYGVNRQTLTCDCPDMGGVVNRAGEKVEGIISRTNRRLVEAGLCPCLLCKHVLIVNLRELADADAWEALLTRLGREWRRVGGAKAIGLAVAAAFNTDKPANELGGPVSHSDEMERLFS